LLIYSAVQSSVASSIGVVGASGAADLGLDVVLLKAAIPGGSMCKTGTASGGTYATGTSKVFYSIPSSNLISQGASIDVNASASQATAGSSTLTDGTGWIPIYFDQLSGGAPISNEPLDPANALQNPASGTTNADFTYRYACNVSTLKWEADTVLESSAYTTQENKMAKDGGNNSNYYEIGTDLKILGGWGEFLAIPEIECRPKPALASLG